MSRTRNATLPSRTASWPRFRANRRKPSSTSVRRRRPRRIWRRNARDSPRIDKLREELNSSTTSKQYAAVQNEMKVLKEKADELDTEALEILEEIEVARAALDELVAKADERSTIQVKATEELAQRRSDVGERLSELEGERAQAASHIPDTVLGTFDKVADDTEGETMCEVREVSRRHRGAPAAHAARNFLDSVVRLTNSDNEVVQCRGCFRILFLAESLAASSPAPADRTRASRSRPRRHHHPCRPGFRNGCGRSHAKPSLSRSSSSSPK